jgi:RNA polymerase sigma-70 factor (ECF subfamily)
MYVGNLEAAEDVVSEVFFKFFKMGRKIAEIDDVTYYLYRSVKNQSISYLRRNVHLTPMYLAHPDTEALGELSIDLHDPHQEFLKNDLQERLQKAISGLPKQKKTIYRLILFERLKYKEVAELLNLSPKTVENHMIEATRKVRLAISHQMEENHQRLQSN